jgi:Fission yeast centromere protein N-terminal domain/Tc5 transposase DNA-binding domain
MDPTNAIQSLNTKISTPTPSKKRRRRISDVQKPAIREYVFDKSHHTKPSLQAVQTWFQDKYPHDKGIAASSLSEIISKRHAYLDNIPDNAATWDQTRRRQAHYPDLEAALYEFQLRMIRKGAAVTGDILTQMAEKIWDHLLQYSTILRPKFSAGRLDSF